ncbi:hypothetical protein OVY48_17395 [Sphingobium sp. SA2]|uniref:hypothetical protein n=1 Tax=unclassified Sphingobium TaxID=2611147 RepID=UPI00050068A0|nr:MULTISPECIES: hypothetical protein [unclassified Sphingobium]AOF98322.1 hypothetical protein BSY17_2592 [Sphingobium sp. RAC03]KFL44762.1 hypothetical protein IL54_0128 [Sphingobium sp. ba1]MDT7535187.1 hypothetical protein [Sphingobium sp. SA2]
MTQHLQLRVHVSEPWDFERIAGTAELSGWTIDHADPANDEWVVHLDEGFDFHERHIGTLLVGPRYVGEHLHRMFDAVAGLPVRVAHRQDDGWHYAFTAMISERADPSDAHDDRNDGTSM